MLLKQLRPRPQPLRHERSKQDCGNIVAGDAEGEKRHHGRPVHRIVRGLGSGHAFQLSLAKSLRVLGGILGGGITHDRRHDLPHSRNGADHSAQCRRAENRPHAGLEVRPSQPITFGPGARAGYDRTLPPLHSKQDFGDSE